MITYFVGVDLGKKRDPAALAVLQRVEMFREKVSLPGTIQWEREPRVIISKYQVRLLEQFPLETKYQSVVMRVSRVMEHPDLSKQAALVMDLTGVGEPVYEMMVGVGLSPIGVTITSGKSVTAVDQGYNVPKRDLVTSLQVLFQTGRMELPGKLKITKHFIDQLQHFTVTINARAHDSYGADDEEVHDDLVIAVALPAWYAEKTVGSQRPDKAVKPKREGFDPLRADL